MSNDDWRDPTPQQLRVFVGDWVEIPESIEVTVVTIEPTNLWEGASWPVGTIPPFTMDLGQWDDTAPAPPCSADDCLERRVPGFTVCRSHR